MLLFFCKGLLMGLVIALPFGPVGVLCLQRAVSSGVLVGLLSGAGAATADALYGGVAAFGLTFLSSFLTSHHEALQVVGGLFLLFMGARLYRRPLREEAPGPGGGYHRLAGSFASIFILSLTNPMTVAAFLAIFAGLGLGAAGTGSQHALAVVSGVFCGSMCWWVAIAFGGQRLRDRLLHRLGTIQKGSGVLVLLFGCWAFVEAFL